MIAVVFCTSFETIDFSVSSRISPVSLGVMTSRLTFGFLNGFFTAAFGAPPSTSSSTLSPPVFFALKFSYSSSESESPVVNRTPAGATALGSSPLSKISIYSISTS